MGWRTLVACGCAQVSMLFLAGVGRADVARSDASVWPSLSASSTGAGGGDNDAAVIIGIEKYAFVASVPGANQNALDWYAYFTKTRRVPSGSVSLISESDATAEHIKKAAASAAKLVKAGGTLWFVFVGHGAPAADGKSGILVGYDVQQTVDSLYARSVSQPDLLKELRPDSSRNTILIVDACFSGRTPAGALVPGAQPMLAVADPEPADSQPEVKVELKKAETRASGKKGDAKKSEAKKSGDKVADDKTAESAPATQVVWLRAGRSDQFAGPLPGLARPAFSYLMLGALRGWADANHDGKVTTGEAVDYARDAMRTVVTDRTQTPELQGESGTVLATSVSEEGPSLANIVMATHATPKAAESALADKPKATAEAAPTPDKVAPLSNPLTATSGSGGPRPLMNTPTIIVVPGPAQSSPPPAWDRPPPATYNLRGAPPPQPNRLAVPQTRPAAGPPGRWSSPPPQPVATPVAPRWGAPAPAPVVLPPPQWAEPEPNTPAARAARNRNARVQPLGSTAIPGAAVGLPGAAAGGAGLGTPLDARAGTARGRLNGAAGAQSIGQPGVPLAPAITPRARPVAPVRAAPPPITPQKPAPPARTPPPARVPANNRVQPRTTTPAN